MKKDRSMSSNVRNLTEIFLIDKLTRKTLNVSQWLNSLKQERKEILRGLRKLDNLWRIHDLYGIVLC